MKHILFIFAVSLFFLACDENSDFSNTPDSEPQEEQPRCFTIEEVSLSKCPAELLTNICSTYSCNFRVGNIEADGSWPPCSGDPNSCEFVDCTTLMCGGSLRYDIGVGEGRLGYKFNSVDQETGEIAEIQVICHQGGIFSFMCGEDGTEFN